MSGHPVVGIIGGMGPEATVELMRRVIAATPAGDDADHIHMIVDNNPKVPSRIAALIEGSGADPAPELVHMARGLAAAGATVLAMPCNTAHAYAGHIAAAVAIPLLDMVALTASRIASMRPAPRRAGMLASSAVRSLGLYEKALRPHGVELAYPARQAEVMEIIKAVKRGDASPVRRRALAEIAADLEDSGSDLLLVACTELSVLAAGLESRLPVLDALDVLSETILAHALGAACPVMRPAAPARLRSAPDGGNGA